LKALETGWAGALTGGGEKAPGKPLYMSCSRRSVGDMVGLSLVTLDGGESAQEPRDSLIIGGMLIEN